MPTIEIPTPSADFVLTLEAITIDTALAEVDAVRAIRERLTPYVKHAGFIKTGSYESNDTAGQATYLHEEGRMLHGLLAHDGFEEDGVGDYGTYSGTRLFLSERGWREVQRAGCWASPSRVPGAEQFWFSDKQSAAIMPEGSHHSVPKGGYVKELTDEQVSDQYRLSDILTGLGEAMATMCQKLPPRYGKLQARAELARRTIAALAEAK